MVREAMAQSCWLPDKSIIRADSRMLLATQHSATGQVTQWIKTIFAKWHINGDLSGFTASGELIAANFPMRCE